MDASPTDVAPSTVGRIAPPREPPYDWRRAGQFAHFSDEELADGIMAVHTTINGLTREQLIDSIAIERARRKDIKEVWSQWDYKPSKVKLAHALWPPLERKIQQRLDDENDPVPEIAEGCL